MKRTDGFTLVEILVYLVITATLLVIITSTVLNIIIARQQARSHDTIQQSARFMVTFLSDRLHQVRTIEDISPDPALYKFYTVSTTDWFRLTNTAGDLVYQEQTGGPQTLNNDNVSLANFQMTPTKASSTAPYNGLVLDWTLETGSPVNPYGYASYSYHTFLGIRQ